MGKKTISKSQFKTLIHLAKTASSDSKEDFRIIEKAFDDIADYIIAHPGKNQKNVKKLSDLIHRTGPAASLSLCRAFSLVAAKNLKSARVIMDALIPLVTQKTKICCDKENRTDNLGEFEGITLGEASIVALGVILENHPELQKEIFRVFEKTALSAEETFTTTVVAESAELAKENPELAPTIINNLEVIASNTGNDETHWFSIEAIEAIALEHKDASLSVLALNALHSASKALDQKNQDSATTTRRTDHLQQATEKILSAQINETRKLALNPS